MTWHALHYKAKKGDSVFFMQKSSNQETLAGKRFIEGSIIRSQNFIKKMTTWIVLCFILGLAMAIKDSMHIALKEAQQIQSVTLHEQLKDARIRNKDKMRKSK